VRGPEVRALECGGLTPPWNDRRQEGQRAGGGRQPAWPPSGRAEGRGQGGVKPPHSKAGFARNQALGLWACPIVV
jgi:hypothetical protein